MEEEKAKWQGDEKKQGGCLVAAEENFLFNLTEIYYGGEAEGSEGMCAKKCDKNHLNGYAVHLDPKTPFCKVYL